MPTARATRARRQSPPVKESEATPSENGIAAAGAKRDRDRDDARDDNARNDANDAPTTTASPEPRSKRAKGTAVESSEKAVDDDFKTLVRIDGNAGRVIGKGGEHVKYIETECSVRLEFRRDEGVAVVRPLASTESGEPTTSERRRADARRAKALIEEAASTGQIMELLTKGVPSDVNEGIRLDPSVIPDDIMRGDDDEDVEAEIPCPGKEGRVIGRGAATIREISARSGASCHVIKGSGVCVAKGKRKCVRMAYQMVHDTLQLSVDRFGAPPQTHSASFHAAPPRVQGLPHGAMVLPNGMAMVPLAAMGVPATAPGATGLDAAVEIPCAGNEGRVVGKGGETIKFLRAQTGCMVDIKHQKTPAAVVVVSGTPANVEMCKAYVYRAMDNGDLRALKSFVPPTVPAAVPYVVPQQPYQHYAVPQQQYHQPLYQPQPYQQPLYQHPPPAHQQQSAGWVRYYDDSGKPYEHNPATNETRWV
jgi:far upstream element-binding protein